MKAYRYIVSDNVVVCIYTHNGRDFIGRAFCDPSDTFDEQKGKDLARIRAIEKSDKYDYQNVKEIVDYLKREINTLQATFDVEYDKFEGLEKRYHITKQAKEALESVMKG